MYRGKRHLQLEFRFFRIVECVDVLFIDCRLRWVFVPEGRFNGIARHFSACLYPYFSPANWPITKGTPEDSLMIVQSAERWAQEQFGDTQLGDVRRSARAVELAAKLAQSPGGTLPDPISKWSELKAAYRFLDTPDVTFDRLQQPHRSSTLEACSARGEYILIEDTTQLDYTSHECTTGLGRIGDDRGRGFHLHSTLAARIERWSQEHEPLLNVQGLLGQRIWVREDETRTGRVSKRQRLEGPRESDRWAEVFDSTGGPPPGVQWTHVADRESDIAEAFIKLRGHGVDFIIRASQPRALIAEEGNLFEVASRAPVKGRFEVPLRARPGQRARTATVQVRACGVMLRAPWRPNKKLPNQPVNVLEIKEVDPPPGTEPLHWVLLTSWPCQTLAQCRAVAQAYGARWLIEEYHKALKSGTGVEESQLQTAHRLQALLALLALVAVRLLGLKQAARVEPDAPVDPDLLGKEVYAVLEAKFGKPKEGWTQRSVLVCIARLGGFLARKGDGDPGWLTIWRGWRRLVLLVEGYSAVRKRCG